MKLLRYGAPGCEKPGILDAQQQIRDLSAVVDDLAGVNLGAQMLAEIASLELESLPLVQSGVRIGPCVGAVGKFICIGLNYVDHCKESGLPVPDEPVVFMKATSAICGPNDGIIKPRGAQKLDWEVELGVVIGQECRYLDASEAAQAIAGYCVVHDVSERSFQLERGGQWDKGKGCDSFGPIGPYLVSAAAVDNPLDLDIWLKVNDKLFQHSNTGQMVFGPAQLIAYLSQFMSLQPGDIISTGTPPGVGMGQNPPLYLQVGDKVTLGINGLGEQTQVVLPEL